MIDAIELLDIGEAAKYLKVSETSLRRWTNARLMPCLRIGRRRERRFRRADLLAFMEQPEVQNDVNGEGGSMTAQTWKDEPVAAIHGNHLCGIYGSDAGRLDLVVPFLLEGLRKKSVCFLIAPAGVQRGVLKAMKKRRPSLDSDVKAKVAAVRA